MRFIDYLMDEYNVSIDVVYGMTDVSVHDNDLKLTIPYVDFHQFCIDLNRVDCSMLAQYETGKKSGKKFNEVRTRYVLLRDKFKKLITNYIDELIEIAKDHYITED